MILYLFWTFCIRHQNRSYDIDQCMKNTCCKPQLFIAWPQRTEPTTAKMISKSKSHDHHGVELQSRVIKIDLYISKYAAHNYSLLFSEMTSVKNNQKQILINSFSNCSQKLHVIFIREYFLNNFTFNNYQIQSLQ